MEQSYFKLLPFAPAEINCLALPEILAEKIRACYQRNKARDIYDLGMFATRPLDQALIRRLVVLKLWQAQDAFEPARLMQKIQGQPRLRLGRPPPTSQPRRDHRPRENQRRLRQLR